MKMESDNRSPENASEMKFQASEKLGLCEVSLEIVPVVRRSIVLT